MEATESTYLFRNLKELEPGDHLCCLYQTEEEHRAMLTPFMRYGLQRNEKVIYIGDVYNADVIQRYLREDGMSVEGYLDRGQLNILGATDAYTKGGNFDPDGMIVLLQEETERALAEGYGALRVTGEMTWALRGLPGSERLIEYEAKLNNFFPDSKCLAVCQYDMRRFGPTILLDVLSTHPVAIVGTEIFDNFYYTPPEDFLGVNQQEARLARRLINLRDRKRVEEALKKSRNDMQRRVEQRTAQLSALVENLRETELRYRTVADFNYDWEYWQRPTGAFEYISPSCERITGYKAEEFIHNPALAEQIILPEDREVWLNHHREAKEGPRLRLIQFRIRRRDGSTCWIEHACRWVKGRQDEFLGFRASNRDITERKQSEEALEKSREDLRRVSARLLEVQEDERKRIARELHDSVGQSLAATKFGLERAIQAIREGATEPDFELLESLVNAIQKVGEEVRRTQTELRPSLLDDLGIVSTISWFCREFEKFYSHIRVETKIEIEEDTVPQALKIVIFRVLQEALNNVAKHSHTEAATISLRTMDGQIELVIRDEGQGFNVEQVQTERTLSERFGLTSMKERVELTRGAFAIESASGSGTVVRAVWQIDKKGKKNVREP